MHLEPSQALFNGEDEDLLKKINEKSFKCVSQLKYWNFGFALLITNALKSSLKIFEETT